MTRWREGRWPPRRLFPGTSRWPGSSIPYLLAAGPPRQPWPNQTEPGRMPVPLASTGEQPLCTCVSVTPCTPRLFSPPVGTGGSPRSLWSVGERKCGAGGGVGNVFYISRLGKQHFADPTPQ